jgi:DNA repair protein RadC
LADWPNYWFAHRSFDAASAQALIYVRRVTSRDALHIREIPRAERPRERMRSHGAHALSTGELLAILIGSGTARRSALALAHEVLARSDGSLRRLAAEPVGLLTAIDGLGDARAGTIHAALELGRRLGSEFRPDGLPLLAPRDVFANYAPRLEDCPVEEFHVAILDAQHRLERDVLITRGLLSSALVHPREVFREAIVGRAASVILVHNHPSGDPTPSPDDCSVTEQLVSAGRLLDIPVRDHVIVGRGRFMSFAESGLL